MAIPPGAWRTLPTPSICTHTVHSFCSPLFICNLHFFLVHIPPPSTHPPQEQHHSDNHHHSDNKHPLHPSNTPILRVYSPLIFPTYPPLSFSPLLPTGMRSAIPLDTADSLVGAMPVRKMPFSAQLLKQPKVVFDMIGKNLDDFAIPGKYI